MKENRFQLIRIEIRHKLKLEHIFKRTYSLTQTIDLYHQYLCYNQPLNIMPPCTPPKQQSYQYTVTKATDQSTNSSSVLTLWFIHESQNEHNAS